MGTWTTKEGNTIPLADLSDRHLLNIQRHLAERVRRILGIYKNVETGFDSLAYLKIYEDVEEGIPFDQLDRLLAMSQAAEIEMEKSVNKLKEISSEVDRRKLKRLPLRPKEDHNV